MDTKKDFTERSICLTICSQSHINVMIILACLTSIPAVFSREPPSWSPFGFCDDSPWMMWDFRNWNWIYKNLTKFCFDNRCKWSYKRFHRKMVYADPLAVHRFCWLAKGPQVPTLKKILVATKAVNKESHSKYFSWIVNLSIWTNVKSLMR